MQSLYHVFISAVSTISTFVSAVSAISAFVSAVSTISTFVSAIRFPYIAPQCSSLC